MTRKVHSLFFPSDVHDIPSIQVTVPKLLCLQIIFALCQTIVALLLSMSG